MLAEAVGSRPHEWFALSESTYALYMLGRWDEAMAAYHELPEELLPTGGTLLSPLSSVLEIHVQRGDLAEARRLLGHLRPDGGVGRHPGAGRLRRRQRVRRTPRAGMPRRSSAGERTLEVGETLGLDGQDIKMGFMWALEAAVAEGRPGEGRRARRADRGDPAGAAAAVARRARSTAPARVWPTPASGVELHAAVAATTFRELGLRFWLAVTQLEHAELLQARRPRRRGRADAAEARAVFAELRAAPWIARADAVSNRASAEAVG